MNVIDKNDLVIERTLMAPIETVFGFVTRQDNLSKWWGPEGTHLDTAIMDFTQPGPWMSVMVNAKGERFEVSGRVTRVDPPNRVEFTWAWHDGETGERGHESTVVISLERSGDNTRFLLTHTELSSPESRDNHVTGWTSSIDRLVRLTK